MGSVVTTAAGLTDGMTALRAWSASAPGSGRPFVPDHVLNVNYSSTVEVDDQGTVHGDPDCGHPDCGVLCDPALVGQRPPRAYRTPTKVTPELVDRVMALRARGLSWRAIDKLTGLSYTAARRLVLSRGGS